MNQVYQLFVSAVLLFGGIVQAQGTPDASLPSEIVATEVPKLPASVSLPKVDRKCTPENPLIGQLVNCIVSVQHSEDFSVNVVVPTGWSAVQQAAAIADSGDGGLLTTRSLTKTPLSMRKLKLFGFAVAWTHVSGAKGTVEIPDNYVAMRSLMASVDEPSFRDFRAPTPDFETFWSRHGVLPLVEINWLLVGLLAALVLATIGALIMTYIQRHLASRDVEEIPWKDPRPAHVIAEEALELLAAEHLPEQGQVLAFYLRLSEILRTYLENRFGLAVARGTDERGEETGLRFPAATSEEIEAALSQHELINQEGFTTLMECLSLMDYVIFGGIRPHVGQTEADRRRIRYCIGLTKAPESETTQDEVLTSSGTTQAPRTLSEESLREAFDLSETDSEESDSSETASVEVDKT